MKRIVILACIWDQLGDIMFAIQIADIFSHFSPKIIFYYKDPDLATKAQTDFIAQNIPEYILCKTPAEVMRKASKLILAADVIFNTTPKYNQMMPRVVSAGYTGQYYRVFDYGLGKDVTYKNDENINRICTGKVSYTLDNSNNIFTGFGPGSSGIFVTETVPVRTLSVWNKERYPYDNIFTCYVNNKNTGLAFIDFIHTKFAGQKNLLVVQGRSWADEFDGLPVVKEGSMGAVKEYHSDVHILQKLFLVEESNELFYYSHPIVAVTGNNSMSACISFKKTIFLDWRVELTKTQCLFYDFVQDHKYDDLLPIFQYLISIIVKNGGTFSSRKKDKLAGYDVAAPHSDILGYINEKRDRLADFYNFITNSHNLQRNLLKLINTPKIGGVQVAPPRVNWFVIITIVTIVIIVIIIIIIIYIISPSWLSG